METPNSNSIFNLSIDENSSYNLKEIAKWAKFLAIIGFVGIGFLVLGMIGLIIGIGLNKIISGMITKGMIDILYFIMGIIYIYPTTTLYKFSVGMKKSLINNDQMGINLALKNLKNCFKLMGIMTIINITICIIFALIELIFSATSLERS